MKRTLAYRVPEGAAPVTVGVFLKQGQGFSRRQLLRLKRRPGALRCNGKPVRTVDRLSPGDCLLVTLEETGMSAEPNPALHVPVVYEDADLVVYEKPPGMPVHPSHRHRDDTLGNAFAAQYPPPAVFRPVNRLDRNTSGLCVVAKHALAAKKLGETLEKTYLAVVEGAPDPTEGIIDAPIARAEDSIITRVVSPSGRSAQTEYKVLRQGAAYALVEFCLLTGRTHQIRVHCAHIGHPLAGDDLYGGSTALIARQALHCGEVRFIHPITEQAVVLKSPIPADIHAILSGNPADCLKTRMNKY